MPSFDIVSEINMSEVRNGIENASREVTSRWDFRNTPAEFSFDEKNEVIKVSSQSDFQINQLLDILCDKLAKRSIHTGSLEIPNEYEHSGKMYHVLVKLKQGIEKELAKEIVKLIKDNKLKVQAQIQGQQVRITSKSRDDLQSAMAVVNSAKLNQPFQFTNFCD